MPYEAVSFPIGGRNVYRGLIVLYGLIGLYSALTVWVGAQTVGQAAGPLYAAVFPVALFFCSAAAMFGVIRSRYTRTVGIEYASTVLLLAGLYSFSGAIIWVATATGEHWRYPGSILPMIASVFVVLRMLNILGVVKEQSRKKLAAKLQAQALAIASEAGGLT